MSKQNWPFLEKLLSNNILEYVDFALAQTLLKKEANPREDVAAFICHLSIAARYGNLCISIQNEKINPSVASIWSDPNNQQPELILSPEDVSHLNQLILSGAKNSPISLFTHVDKTTTDLEHVQTPICRLDHLYYFHKYWVYETFCINQLHRILKNQPSIKLDETVVEKQIQNLIANNKLLPEQAQAIKLSCQSALSIITGGPGTGKTYTAAELIKTFWQSMSECQRQSFKIALAAPTGKAAANLQASLSRILGELDGFPEIQATTIHSLLEISSKITLKNEIKTLNADLILIDESSMIDLYLMSHLLSSIKQGARLVLLGDSYQLPPVEAGSLFSDIVTHLKNQPNQNHVCELKKCLRAELQAIIDFAYFIKNGNLENASDFLLTKENHPISRIDFSQNIKHTQEAILKNISHFKVTNDCEDPIQLLNFFNRFRILSPFRKGTFGIEQLNSLFFNALTKTKSTKDIVYPIMLVQNDRRLDLFNGEVGILVRSFNGEKDYAIFPSRNKNDPGSIRKFPSILLPQFEFAFCLSVHKSQGSEFDHVLLIMPEGSEIFGREVLYTAVTRAKKKLDLFISDETLSKTISNPSQRLSGISLRI